MNLDLPYTLKVDNEEKQIYCDFRDVINIFIALNDNELSEAEKIHIVLTNLYVDDYTQFEDIQEALKQAYWFFDCGKEFSEEEKKGPKLMDWEQD